jgi:hypothetical protein
MPDHGTIASETIAGFGPGKLGRPTRRVGAGREVVAIRNPFLLALAAFSILLIRLPVYYGHSRLFKITILVLLLMGIMALVPLLHRRLMSGSMWLAVLYAGAIAVEIVRGARQGAYSDFNSGAIEAATYVSALLFAALLVATGQTRADRRQRLLALLCAPAIYVVANAVLHLNGAVSQASLSRATASVAANTPATLLGKLGIGALRVEFPLAESINGFGIVAAAVLASMAVLAHRSRRTSLRLACAGFAVASLYCLLLGDNRGSLLIAAVVIIVFLLFKRLTAVRVVALLIPVFPLLVVWWLKLISSSSLVTTFSRNGENLATGTNRLYIWEGAWGILQHPSIHWLYGWGAGGQITSGASRSYAYIFGNLPTALTENTHNVVLQTMLDGGAIALLALIAACFAAMTNLSRAADEPVCAALLASLLVVVLSGLTEDAPSYYTQEVLLIVLFALGAAAAIGLLPGEMGREVSSESQGPRPRRLNRSRRSIGDRRQHGQAVRS